MAYQDTLSSYQASHHIPHVREITPSDLVDALRKGFDDFWAMPTHVLFLSLIYPIAGLIIARATLGYDLIPLLYPLAAGFALLGPFAAIGIYELSRRRELGLDTSWTHAFDVVHADAFRAILALGLMLLVMFGIWIAVAHTVYVMHFGYREPDSLVTFAQQVFSTDAGWSMILIGNGIGFLFALVAFSLTVVAFPLMVERNITATAAAATSVRAVLKNPLTMALWGLIVAVALFIGSIPFFAGLAVVVPVLGHATWHLYRKVVEPELNFRMEPQRRARPVHYAAEFPATLFSGYRRDEQRE